MQRRLVCKTKQCPGTGRPEDRGYATLPGGKPYLMGRSPTKFPFTYRDAACGFPTTLSAQEFNAQPFLSMVELSALGELDRLTQDLRGAGFEPFQGKDGQTIRPAEDLFAAGLTSPARVEARVADFTPKEDAKPLTRRGRKA